MIYATNFDVRPDNTAEANRNGIVRALQSLSKTHGGVLYFPPGRYKTKSISKEMLDKNDTRYVSLRGDGVKSSILELDSKETRPLWDWDGLRYFDVSMEKMAFYGNKKDLPFVMKFWSGGIHYRISLRDVEFRYNGGDGLVMHGGQLALLDMVTCQQVDGWGLRISGFNSISANSLDVEGCKTGGVLFERDKSRRRDYIHCSINNLYVERTTPGVRIDGVSGVQINETMPCKIEFTGGAFGNHIFGSRILADFQKAHNNYVVGFPYREGSPRLQGVGRDVSLNYVGPPGGGLPCQIYGAREHLKAKLFPGNIDDEKYISRFKVTPGSSYSVRFSAREVIPNNPLLAVVFQQKKDSYYQWWNVMDRKWSDKSSSFGIAVGRDLKRFRIPFVASEPDINIIFHLGTSQSHIEIHDVMLCDET